MVIFLFFASPNCVHHKLPTIQFYRLSRKYPSREPIPLNAMVFFYYLQMNQNGWSSSFAMRLLPLGTRPTAIQIPWMEGKLKYRLLFASVLLLVRGIQLKR
jgi:hypothetical protein